MRQVFSSRRVDNVEKVAQLLRDAGIEVKVTDGQSYHGSRGRNFSYRERPGNEDAPRPAVWIVRAEDQIRGRELLREAGLLESTRPGDANALPPLAPAMDAGARRLPWRAMLMALIAGGMGLVWYANHRLKQGDAPVVAAAQAPARPAPTPVDVLDAQRPMHDLPVPAALAALLVREARWDGPPPCVVVDGAAAGDAVRNALGGMPIADGASCGNQVDIRIGPWRTDGSGEGTVAVQVMDGAVVTHGAQRQGATWRLLDAAP